MLLGKKNTTLQTYSTHELQCSPPPKKSFFLWCIHFSKVTSEAFPSWPLKQHQKKKTKKPAPRSTWSHCCGLDRFPAYRCHGRSSRVGGCWYFSKTFSLTRGGGWRWSDEWGSVCPAAWVTQQQFPIHTIFFFPLQNLVSFIPSFSSRKKKRRNKSRYRYV